MTTTSPVVYYDPATETPADAQKRAQFALTSPEPKALTEMDLLQVALQNNAAIDVIERIAALRDKSMARDAEQQFTEAMNLAQSELGRIAPDMENTQTKSKTASYAALDRVIRPIYTKHGFSLSFDSGDSPLPEMVRVFCYVSHRAGHTRKYQAPLMPADGKGAKGGDVMTKTHATGSAMSYGMRYLLKFIFNVAIGEDDNDGNLDGELRERIEFLKNCCTKAELGSLFKTYYAEYPNKRDKLALLDAYEVRKAELNKEGR